MKNNAPNYFSSGDAKDMGVFIKRINLKNIYTL